MDAGHCLCIVICLKPRHVCYSMYIVKSKIKGKRNDMMGEADACARREKEMPLLESSGGDLLRRLGLEVLDKCPKLHLGLVCRVVLVRGVEQDIGESLEEVLHVGREDLGLIAVNGENGSKDGRVFERVKLQWQDRREQRNSLLERDGTNVFRDHAADSAGSIVARIVDCRCRVLGGVKVRSEDREQGRVVRAEVHLRVLDQDTRGERGVGTDIGLGIAQTARDDLEQGLRKLRDALLETDDDFTQAADRH